MQSAVSPWLSIVTVVKDAAADFAATMASIAPQNLEGIDVVVVDSSADREAITSTLARRPELPAQYQWIEPAGVYPAMNAGLLAARGEYVYFLNAGDTLADAGVLTRVGTVLRQQRPEWMYAEVLMTDAQGRQRPTPKWDYDAEQRACFSRGHFPCHQGTFAARQALLDLGGFDTEYRIVADYAVFLELSKRSQPVHLDEVIAVFQPGGMSTVHWRAASREFHRARKRILAPHGTSAGREQAQTWLLLAKMSAYRSLLPVMKMCRRPVARLRGQRQPPHRAGIVER